MAVEDALAALREHWNDVIAQLTPEAADELRRLVPEIGGPGRQAAVDRVIDILNAGLPVRHPVRRALVRGHLFAPPVTDWAAISAALTEQAGPPPGDPVANDPVASDPVVNDAVANDPGADDAPSVAEIQRIVTERLLAAPALSEQQVREHGTDPADPGLLRLTRADGGHQWPAFQFLPDKGTHPLVRVINKVLNAAGDPVGVADWWLSPNSWLDGRPSELLGQLPDEALLGAAQAIRSEV
jgi:hypothetical protein